MSDLGKIDAAFFDNYVYPYLGADRSDELLGPTHGVDFGVVNVGDEVMAVATDPISILPSLGFERAARFAFHVVVSDVAVSGLRPSHVTLNLAFPPEVEDSELQTIWRSFHREAEALGMSLVAEHVGRYADCQFPMVGGATAVAVGSPDDLVRPDGAQPGDRVIVTKGPGVETAGLLTTLFEKHVDLPDAVLESAKGRLDDASPIRDAFVASDAGTVTAMHDATECGLEGALVELAGAAGVRLAISRDAAPVMPGVQEACRFFELNPWQVNSAGTLLLTVDADDAGDVLAALDDEGIPAADIGVVEQGEGVFADGERVEHPEVDESWRVYAEYAELE